jgi:hypothetical protein
MRLSMLSVVLLALATIAVLICPACDRIGSACATDRDCGSDAVCVFKIADGCGAKATCQAKPTGPMCNIVIGYCGCEGQEVGVGCDKPGGYLSMPVVGLMGGAVCPGGALDGGGVDGPGG